MIVECRHLISCLESMPARGPNCFAGQCSKCGAEAIVQIEHAGTLIGQGVGEPLTEILTELPELGTEPPDAGLVDRMAQILRDDLAANPPPSKPQE